MYLYLGNSPRVLYLVTSSHDDRLGRPSRALVFRAGESGSQAVVEFLPKDEIDLSNAVRLTARVVKGCLGLISIDNGAFFPLLTAVLAQIHLRRHLPRSGDKCHRSWEHQAFGIQT